MRKFKKYYMPLVLAFFLLILFSGLFYIFNALNSFKQYQEKVDKHIYLTKERLVYLLKDSLKREFIKHTSLPVLSDNKSSLKTFHITVKKENLNILNSNLPKSGKEHYIKGYLRVSNDNEIYKIKLRYRGDTFLHWLYKQKSLRIKLNGVYDNAKAINLINPPHDFSIIDCVAYNISKEEGLISPKYEPVRVFINKEYMGVYIYLSQVDESLLRFYKRMPGSIYYGDVSPSKDTNLSTPCKLFFNASLWQKKASRNAEQKSNKEDIELFAKAISLNQKEFEKFAKQYLDLDKYALFLALDSFFGSFHHDYSHNHKIYFDPYKGKFEPIQWDLRYWSNFPYKDNSIYPLMQKLKQMPLFEAKRDKLTYHLLKKYPAKKIISMLEHYKKIVLRDLRSDIYRDTGKLPKEFPKGIAVSFTIKEFEKSIKLYENIIIQREKFLKKLFNNTKLYYMQKDGKLYLKITGNSPLVLSNDGKKLLFYTQKRKEKISKNFAPFLYGTHRLVPKATYYELNTTYTDIKSLKFKNYITQKPVTPIMATFKPDRLSLPLNLNIKNTEQITLKGEIEVKKDLIFPKNSTVNIKPGTTFTLYPKTSIIFYGKVIAKGTKEKPIIFKAKNPKKPWGSVILQGKGCSSSLFEYAEFSNGSVAVKNLIHYTAQLNIHDTKNVTLKNITLKTNHIGDDSMHIAYSTAKVQNALFINAISDSLDIDISDVNVTDSTFINSGNDALDVMTTKLIAKNCNFINSGDKGISVGEASDISVYDSNFTSNFIGIEVKDNSFAFIKNINFKNSKKYSIHLYNKNKRYKYGGTLKAENLHFLSKKKIKADKKSKVEIK